MAKFKPQTDPLSEEEIQEQTRFRIEKLKALQAEGKDPYEELTYDVTNHSTEITGDYEAFAGKTVRVAGRLMSKRGMGKVSFCDLYDRRGKIQIFTKIDNLPEEEYQAWQNLDIGDLVGVEGEVYMTEKGEVSILTKAYKLLAKCLHPLPNKYQGLKDTEIRYRQRYLDLIVNPQVKDTFEKRSKIIKEIRNFLADRDFMEVETPLLVTNAGGAAARPFETHFNALDIDLKLRISLELYLKRLLVGGFERVFEIGRVFRNEGMDTRHNPEFTLMELYQAYTDYNGMMELTESMFRYVAEKVCGTTLIKYGDLEIDFGKEGAVVDFLTGKQLGTGPKVSLPFKKGETKIFQVVPGPGSHRSEHWQNCHFRTLWGRHPIVQTLSSTNRVPTVPRPPRRNGAKISRPNTLSAGELVFTPGSLKVSVSSAASGRRNAGLEKVESEQHEFEMK